ncbi:MAG TPA: class I adenylate-forming enzyme family protein [Xanthobacteraceae bacterium]|nr:class I adenylate-forming enzyme family protein [Xanthobacteraceae bacterium]
MQASVFGDHRLGIPYQPIAELFAKYRARDPNKTAIVDLDENSSITFGELEQVTIDIAADLKRRGVAKGDRVLLLSDECLEKLLIWFGVWRIGAVVCPLNIEINEKMMVELTRSVNPKIIFCHQDLNVAALVGDHPAPRLRFGRWGQIIDPRDEFFAKLPPRRSQDELTERNNPDDVACIFCTSGTTARPKIVVYDHCAYWLNGLSTLEFLSLTEDDRTLEYRSFGWNSAQVLSLMPFLEKGLTMHIAKRFSHSRFFEWIKTYGITFSAGVPTVLNMLLNKPLGYTAKDVPTLRLMTCSTAPLTAQQWAQFEEMYGVRLLQCYGMSEAGWVCGNRTYKNKIGTVGVPALHQEFEIVGPDGKPVAPGVEGEITAGGPHTAIGYLRDDGTIEPIRPARIKTGDLGIMDEEGFVRVSGRTKDLIIRGGVNIAPLEIDEALLKHPGILDAAAVGVPDKIYGEEIVCYVAPKERGLTVESVLQHARQHLPAAKMPKQVMIVPDLPKSDRGKVLRDKLREDWIRRMGGSA